MAFKGKLIGGALGFFIGGPIGAILGAVAGHQADRFSKSAPDAESPRVRISQVLHPPQPPADETSIRLVVSVTVLAAKLSIADGVSSPVEFEAFRRKFLSNSELGKEMTDIFNQAKQDTHGYEECAQQIASLVGKDRGQLLTILEILVVVASADHTYDRAEQQFINRIATIFGIETTVVRQLEAMYSAVVHVTKVDPYEVLGVSRSASDASVRASYRSLVKASHPDAAKARGMPEDLIKICEDRMKNINSAYDKIRKERNLPR